MHSRDLFLLAPTDTTSKVVLGLWSKELLSNDARLALRKGAMRKFQTWIRIMPKPKKEPIGEGNPEVPAYGYGYFNQVPPLDPRGNLKNI